ncbi:unnamed protein product [Calypogeia fissa]
MVSLTLASVKKVHLVIRFALRTLWRSFPRFGPLMPVASRTWAREFRASRQLRSSGHRHCHSASLYQRQRRRKEPSPVEQRALERNFLASHIFSPLKAGEESFLTELKELKPDFCVTAAYANILPNKFLSLPTCESF